MQVKARMLIQPLVDRLMVVGAIIVQDQTQVQTRRSFTIDLTQELQKLLIPMSGIATPNHRAFQPIERSEHAGGSVAFIVVRHGPTPPLFHRQSRLGSIQGLHLDRKSTRLNSSHANISYAA